jgi:hypothetical protein
MKRWASRSRICTKCYDQYISALPFLKDSIFILCEYTCTDSLLDIQDSEQEAASTAQIRIPDRNHTQVRTGRSRTALAIAIISHNTGVLLCSTATTSSRKLRNIKDDSWYTPEAFSARCQKLLEDMTNVEEVRCCRDRDTPTNHQDCLDEFRQMCRYSNVGGGFTGRSTGWAGCTTNILILSCDVVSNVRSNGQAFRLVTRMFRAVTLFGSA